MKGKEGQKKGRNQQQEQKGKIQTPEDANSAELPGNARINGVS